MSLESGYTTTLHVDRPTGRITMVFEKWSGGEADSEEAKHRNPVTRRQTARGGQRMRTNVTLSRECDAEAWALIPELEDAIGVDPVVAVRQMVSARGAVIGKPKQVTGLIKSVKAPDYDLAGGDVGQLEVEISTDE